jgi:hypothetical protein
METLANCVTLVQTESAQLTQYLYDLPSDAWYQPSACTQWQIAGCGCPLNHGC